MESDDDIQIMESGHSADKGNAAVNDMCQLCSHKLQGLSVAERDDHYSEHASGPSAASRPRRGKPTSPPAIVSQGKPSPTRYGKSAKKVLREDVFWYPAQAVEPPDNYSPGVLSVLKEALKKSYKKGSIKRAVLCYERTPHILRESFDRNWGCGHVGSYRNFLMTCAALMDQPSQAVYFPHLDAPSPPGVRNLQRWIEDAWKDGYDEIGARELDHELVDTKKKIGTGELYVAFTSRKIPCTLVDFDLRNSSRGFEMLTDWVVNYFTEKTEGDVHQILRKATPVAATNKMPVIMQFHGHSMTIVGYELGKNDKCNLLVFDPSSKVPEDIRVTALSTSTGANWEASSSRSLGKSKRRERSTSPVSRKRSRTNQECNGGVVGIPDSDNEEIDGVRQAAALKSNLDPDKVVKTFRLSKHKQKKEYQLLHFTMGDPLSDQEQNDRKVVLAEC